MKSKLSVLLLTLIAASCLVQPRLVNAVSGNGNSPCVTGRNAAPFGFWTWPANTEVSVYLREPDFSEADLAAIRVSVQNWDRSAAENGSHVRFQVRGLTHTTKTAAGDMTLIRGDVYNKKLRHLALLEAHSLREDRMIDYAVVAVDRSVKSAEVLINVVAHEIGHTLGLLDCIDCNDKSTAMGLMKGSSTSNGIEGPTSCDKQSVGSAYRDLLARGGQTTASARLEKAVVDEGEEPEEDDTAVVVRKP